MTQENRTDFPYEGSSLRRLPKQARSQQRVDRILNAAAEVFLEVGYEAATSHLIAARANTAIGSLYQFFPDKLAIFRALELRHIQQGRELGEMVFTPTMAQIPLEQFVEQMIEHCAEFFKHPAPRAIFMQYFTNPSLFQHIDKSFTQEFVQLLSDVLLLKNPSLSRDKCSLLANVTMQCFNTLMLDALQSNASYRQTLFSEIQNLIVAYLQPHVEEVKLHNYVMVCPHCHSQRTTKNGHRHGKQRYRCKDCSKQFPEDYTNRGYPEPIKQKCLDLYRQGTSFRAIEKATGVSHNTVIIWVKQSENDSKDRPIN